MTGDYKHFSQMAFVLVRDPVAAEVIAIDAVLAAIRPTRAPDAPPGIQRGKRKLVRQTMSYMRRRRLLRLLPWTKERPAGVELPERTRQVWDAIAELRPRQQVAVVLARYDGSNLSELADALDSSASAAGSHLEKARKALTERLGADVDLRPLLTRELHSVAQAFAREHRPDPTPVEDAMLRSGRWRAWGFGLAAIAAGIGVALVNALRG